MRNTASFTPNDMDVFATGFNAWDQLNFSTNKDATVRQRPKDFKSLTKVLSDTSINRLHASLSCVLVEGSTGLLQAGCADEWMRFHDLRHKVVSSIAAIAGNGSIAVYDGDTSILQYRSLNHFKADEVQYCASGLDKIVQVVAYETGFAALATDGRVWTWGDERYSACLGREVSDSSPAAQAACVAELEDLPTGKIRKIAAGGYLLLALTEGSDLYAWGGHPGRPAIVEGLSGSPSPLIIEDNDIADCAVGESHVVVLTLAGEIFAIGDNRNGQLGTQPDKTTTWTRVPLDTETRSTKVGVICGPRNSFVIVKNNSIAS